MPPEAGQRRSGSHGSKSRALGRSRSATSQQRGVCRSPWSARVPLDLESPIHCKGSAAWANSENPDTGSVARAAPVTRVVPLQQRGYRWSPYLVLTNRVGRRRTLEVMQPLRHLIAVACVAASTACASRCPTSPTGFSQSSGTFTDSRDGQTYKTIRFENALTGTTVTWMAQNLNYHVVGSYAYDDEEGNRKELGLLYTWEAAIAACPSGWHLATDSEWAMLVAMFGGTETAGDALKSASGWTEDGNGTNASGFDALPAGIRRDDSYDVLGVMGFWWTSTPAAEDGKAWGWNFSYGGPGEKPLRTKAFRFASSCHHAKSVRCVRD